MLVAGGGIGGSEGSVTLAVRGVKRDVELAIDVAAGVKGEPAVAPLKGLCNECPYEHCAFYGKTQEQLPAWLREAKAA